MGLGNYGLKGSREARLRLGPILDVQEPERLEGGHPRFDFEMFCRFCPASSTTVDVLSYVSTRLYWPKSPLLKKRTGLT